MLRIRNSGWCETPGDPGGLLAVDPEHVLARGPLHREHVVPGPPAVAPAGQEAAGFAIGPPTLVSSSPRAAWRWTTRHQPLAAPAAPYHSTTSISAPHGVGPVSRSPRGCSQNAPCWPRCRWNRIRAAATPYWKSNELLRRDVAVEPVGVDADRVARDGRTTRRSRPARAGSGSTLSRSVPPLTCDRRRVAFRARAAAPRVVELDPVLPRGPERHAVEVVDEGGCSPGGRRRRRGADRGQTRRTPPPGRGTLPRCHRSASRPRTGRCPLGHSAAWRLATSGPDDVPRGGPSCLGPVGSRSPSAPCGRCGEQPESHPAERSEGARRR